MCISSVVNAVGIGHFDHAIHVIAGFQPEASKGILQEQVFLGGQVDGKYLVDIVVPRSKEHTTDTLGKSSRTTIGIERDGVPNGNALQKVIPGSIDGAHAGDIDVVKGWLNTDLITTICEKARLGVDAVFAQSVRHQLEPEGFGRTIGCTGDIVGRWFNVGAIRTSVRTCTR